jgi:dihydroxy-acid dehydratase
MIFLNAEAGLLEMRVDEAELARRRTEWRPPAELYPRSFTALYKRSVSQADQGCDFDFLAGTGKLPEPSIF